MRNDLLRTLALSVALGVSACGPQAAPASTDESSASGGKVAQAGVSGQPHGGATNGGQGSTAGGSATAGNNLGGASTSGGGVGQSGATFGGAGSGGRGSAGGGSSGGTSPAVAGSGGTSSTGGGGGVGGTSGSGGGDADPPCPVQTPPSGGKQYCSPPSNGSAGGKYSYDLWSDGKGSGCLTAYGVDGAFKANWMNVGDWIARVGLSFDKSKTYDQLGVFSSDFSYTVTGVTSGGFGNVGIYGWSVNPLHEFYIEENWLGKAPNFTKVGTFTIDGEGTYDVMTNTQTNQPNITGTNATFVQFWSVRKTKRQCGHISISKHFDQWKSLGLELGKLEEVRMSVEGQNNSGTIDFTTATVIVK